MSATTPADVFSRPLVVFPVGVAFLPYGAATSTSVLSRNRAELKWAPTVCGETMRDGSGATLGFATPEEAVRYAVERVEDETKPAEVNVARYGWNEPVWKRGLMGPCLGYCPTIQATRWAVWGGAGTGSHGHASSAYNRVREAA